MTESTMLVPVSGCNSECGGKDGKSHAPGWRMLLSLGACFFLMLLTSLPAIGQEETQSVADAARAARAKSTRPSSSNPGRVGQPPVTASQLVAWQVAGVQPGDILNEISARGIAFAPDSEHTDALNQAQVAPEIVAALSGAASHPGTSSSGEIPPELLTASQAFHATDYRSAIQALQGLAQQNQNPDLYAALGNLQVLAKNLPLAKTAFQKAVQFDPTFAYAHVRLAGIYYKLEDTPNMVMEAKMALQLQPGNAEARKYVALSYARDGLGGAGSSPVAPKSPESSTAPLTAKPLPPPAPGVHL